MIQVGWLEGRVSVCLSVTQVVLSALPRVCLSVCVSVTCAGGASDQHRGDVADNRRDRLCDWPGLRQAEQLQCSHWHGVTCRHAHLQGIRQPARRCVSHTDCHRGGCCKCKVYRQGWLGSRVVSVLDSVTVGPGLKSQVRWCRVTVIGKLFTPIVTLFTKQRNW